MRQLERRPVGGEGGDRPSRRAAATEPAGAPDAADPIPTLAADQDLQQVAGRDREQGRDGEPEDA